MGKRRMREKDAIILAGALGLVILLLAGPLWGPMIWNGPEPAAAPRAASGSAGRQAEPKEKKAEVRPIINEAGMTLKERVNPPAGYARTKERKGSFAEFLRGYELKKSTGVVRTWDGKKCEDQSSVQAVFKLPLAKENLQWAAGTVMRAYAEYFYEKGQYERLTFRLRDGFRAEFERWTEGFRIRMSTRGAVWVTGGESGSERKNLETYLHDIMLYSSAVSLDKESKGVKKEEVRAGDVFLKTSGDADAVLVVDACKNKDGRMAVLLARGGKPAQEFHLLKNPAHEGDPWYYVDEIEYPFHVPGGTFEKGTLKRPPYLTNGVSAS